MNSSTKPSSSELELADGQRSSQNRLLLANIAWMLVGNLLYGFSQWGQLIALAKIGTIEMVGSFALALAVCVPILMFSSLSLRSLQVTDYKQTHRFLEYVTVRLLTLLLAIIIIVAIGVAVGYSSVVILATALIGGAKAIEYVSDILYASMQQKENMAGIAISMIVRSVISVSSLSLGVYLSHSLLWGALCLLLSSAVILFAYDIPKTLSVADLEFRVVLRETIRFCKELVHLGGHRQLQKLVKSGLPLGFVLLMVSLNLNIPRYFIKQHLGMRDLAIFSAVATLLAAGSVATNAIGQAAAPRLARSFATGDRRAFKALLLALVVASLGLGALGFVGALLFGQRAMTLLYRPEYSTHPELLMWLMASSGFFYLGSTLGYAVTAVRCFAPQLPLFTAAAVTTGIGCIVLVPRFGLQGAAIAILISSIVQCVGSAFLLWNSCRTADRLAAPTC
jgi:O-antigen/teichoic acid export membrane protein